MLVRILQTFESCRVLVCRRSGHLNPIIVMSPLYDTVNRSIMIISFSFSSSRMLSSYQSLARQRHGKLFVDVQSKFCDLHLPEHRECQKCLFMGRHRRRPHRSQTGQGSLPTALSRSSHCCEPQSNPPCTCTSAPPQTSPVHKHCRIFSRL